MITLVIKGDYLAAEHAAERYGVSLRTVWCKRAGETFATCGDENRAACAAWYCASTSADCVDGQGYPPGTLLLHN